MKVVSDTDFLSAFLKIKRIDLLLKTLLIKRIFIPEEVFFEISQAPFILKELLNYPQIKVLASGVSLKETPDFLGKGEIGAVFLSKKEKAVLLCNDKKAIEFAQSQKVKVLDIFRFLLLTKERKIASKTEIKEILLGLKEKDYLELGKDREKMLF